MKSEAEDYLRDKERGFLATVGDGRPTIVPVCFVYESGKIYTAIDRKPKTRLPLARLTNIGKNPHVAFLVDTYTDDWRRLSYLLIHGEAFKVENQKEREKAKQMLLTKYPQYRWLKLEDSAILCVEVEGVKLWKFQP